MLPPPDALTEVPALPGARVRIRVPGGAEGPGEEAEEGAEERGAEAAAGGRHRCGSKPSEQAGPGIPVQVSGAGSPPPRGRGAGPPSHQENEDQLSAGQDDGLRVSLKGSWARDGGGGGVSAPPSTCHSHPRQLSKSVSPLSIVTAPTIARTRRFPPGTVLTCDPGHPARDWGWRPGTGSGAGLLGPSGRSGRADRPGHVCRVNPEGGQEGRCGDCGILEPSQKELPCPAALGLGIQQNPPDSWTGLSTRESAAGHPFCFSPSPSPLPWLELGDPASGLGRAHMCPVGQIGGCLPPSPSELGTKWGAQDGVRGGLGPARIPRGVGAHSPLRPARCL